MPAPRSNNRRSLSASLVSLTLDRADPGSLQDQLYDQLRELILSGRLAVGARLPSTRALARELACSRNTTVNAYDRLFAEGYLESQAGSGTYVSGVLPEDLLRTSNQDSSMNPESTPRPDRPMGLSSRGESFVSLRQGGPPDLAAFTLGVPEIGSFPFELWARLLTRTWRRPTSELWRPGDAAGHGPLREAIAQYVRAARAVECDWRQVIITSGAQLGLSLAAQCLLDPGDKVWVENPGYAGLHGPLLAAGLVPVPVPVDDQGLSLEDGLARAPDAKMAVVTPSHHYPLGTVMSLPRRLALLDWARDRSAWILEDDYDSEYRYAGRPLSALQGLDRAGRVIYIGSFSKVLFPALRLGYVVAPLEISEFLVQARAALEDHPSTVAQPALAAFFAEGHFAAHIRRMRRLYASRQACLVRAAEAHLSDLLVLKPDEAGLHLLARLSAPLALRMDDQTASAKARRAGIVAPALSRFYSGATGGQGLLLGYAGVSETEIPEKVRILAEALG
ncbi:MAG: PLP-dependent aminotransferase family protein [Pseudomonadota bacterium]